MPHPGQLPQLPELGGHSKIDEESGKVITDHIAGLEALPLGRKTYEIFAAYWPQQPTSGSRCARGSFPVVMSGNREI